MTNKRKRDGAPSEPPVLPGAVEPVSPPEHEILQPPAHASEEIPGRPTERAFVEATARLAELPRPEAEDSASSRRRRRAVKQTTPDQPEGNDSRDLAPAQTTIVLEEIQVVALEAMPAGSKRGGRRGTARNAAGAVPATPVNPIVSPEPLPPLAQVKEQADQVAREVDDIRGEARALRQEIGELSDLAARVDALGAEVRDAEKRLQRLSERREVERLGEALQDVAGQAATLRQHVAEAEKLLADLRGQADAFAERTAAQGVTLADLRRRALEQVDEAAGDLVRLRASFQELESVLLERCTPLEQRLKGLEGDATEGWRLLRTLQEEIETTRQRLREQQEELRAGSALVQELRAQIREAEELLEAIRREFWAARDLPRPAHPTPVPAPTTPVVAVVPVGAAVPSAPQPLAEEPRAEEPVAPAAPAAEASDGRTLGVTVDHTGEIVEVLPDSPGERAGLIPGDRITAVNGDEVSDGESLRDAVHRSAPGSDLMLQVHRGDETTEVMARIEPHAVAEAGAS